MDEQSEKSLVDNINARQVGEDCIEYIDGETKLFDDRKHKKIILGIVWKWLKEHPLAKSPVKPSKVAPNATTNKLRLKTDYAIELCDQILSAAEEVSGISDDGYGFADSVTETTRGIQKTIERTGRVTDGQQESLDNMLSGLERWLD